MDAAQVYNGFLFALVGVSSTMLALILALPKNTTGTQRQRLSLAALALFVVAVSGFIGAVLLTEVATPVGISSPPPETRPNWQMISRLYTIGSVPTVIAPFTFFFALVLIMQSFHAELADITRRMALPFIIVCAAASSIMLFEYIPTLRLHPVQEHIARAAVMIGPVVSLVVFFRVNPDDIMARMLPLGASAFASGASFLTFAFTFDQHRGFNSLELMIYVLCSVIPTGALTGLICRLSLPGEDPGKPRVSQAPVSHTTGPAM
jgi:hypothetical protein